MKKLATLLAASLLGLGTVASADPSFKMHGHVSVTIGGTTASASSGAGTASAVIIRDHRTPQPAPGQLAHNVRWIKPKQVIVRPAPRPMPPEPPVVILPSPWVELGTVAPGKQTINGVDGMKLDSLMLEIKGSLDLRQVVVRFADGQEQLAKFDGFEGSRKFIDLAGKDREIARVIVYSKGSSGEIRVLGRNDVNRTLPSPVTEWSKLGTVSSGKQTLKLDCTKPFDVLGLTIEGSVHLHKVLVRFANGESQVMSYEERYTGDMRAPIIDLAGTDRVIASVIVYTDSDDRGEVSLYAL
jgi:hypothetical protein